MSQFVCISLQSIGTPFISRQSASIISLRSQTGPMGLVQLCWFCLESGVYTKSHWFLTVCISFRDIDYCLLANVCWWHYSYTNIISLSSRYHYLWAKGFPWLTWANLAIFWGCHPLAPLVSYFYHDISTQLIFFSVPICSTVTHVVHQQTLRLCSTPRVRQSFIPLYIGVLLAPYIISHLLDMTYLIMSNIFAYSCMIPVSRTWMPLNAFFVSFVAQLIMVFRYI